MIALLAQFAAFNLLQWITGAGAAIVIITLGVLVMLAKFYRKVGPEQAIVRSGVSGMRAMTGRGIFVIPILHRAEVMDLSLKRIEIKRRGEAGLICMDNVRAFLDGFKPLTPVPESQ